MIPELLIANALEPALKLSPARLDSPAARAMLVAIALQESRIQHRRQIGGPARSYWQMEQGGGVRGVLTHPASKPLIQPALAALDYSPAATENDCWIAIEHNDILAAVFARLLLWVLPGTLPAQNDPNEGWAQYQSAWRPGKPKRETWGLFYAEAWAKVTV